MALINKKIGEILVEEGLISQGELENILKNPPKEKLGEYLISLGLIKEKDLSQVLSKQTGLPIFDPRKFPIDPALAQILPLDLVQKHKVIPLKLQGRILTLGMVDPLDMEAVDTIEIYTNKEVDPVVCTPLNLSKLQPLFMEVKKSWMKLLKK